MDTESFTLHRGDCLALMGEFAPQSFDLIFADPPYFLSNGGSTCRGGKRVSVEKGAWDASQGIDHDFAFNLKWLEQCQRLLKPTGTLWVSGTQHVIYQVGFAMQRLGYKLLNTVTWFKPNASPNLSCRYFTHSTELLIWASPTSRGKLQHTFNYKDMKVQNGGKQMRDLWTMTAPKKSEKAFGRHPTQKPLELLVRILQASTREGARVLDPFCGSGTTGVAALGLNRSFVGIEQDEQHFRLAERRLQHADAERLKTH